MLTIHFEEIKRYFRLKATENLEEELEKVKWASKPTREFFDKILCSCGAVLEIPAVYATVFCDCNNKITFSEHHTTGADEGDLFEAHVEAERPIYVSDYIDALGIRAGKNVVVLRGAYERHKSYERRVELEKRLSYMKEELRKLKKIEQIARQKEFEIDVSDLYTKDFVAVRRDDEKKVFLMTSQYFISEYFREPIERFLKQFYSDYSFRWQTLNFRI